MLTTNLSTNNLIGLNQSPLTNIQSLVTNLKNQLNSLKYNLYQSTQFYKSIQSQEKNLFQNLTQNNYPQRKSYFLFLDQLENNINFLKRIPQNSQEYHNQKNQIDRTIEQYQQYLNGIQMSFNPTKQNTMQNLVVRSRTSSIKKNFRTSSDSQYKQYPQRIYQQNYTPTDMYTSKKIYQRDYTPSKLYQQFQQKKPVFQASINTQSQPILKFQNQQKIQIKSNFENTLHKFKQVPQKPQVIQNIQKITQQKQFSMNDNLNQKFENFLNTLDQQTQQELKKQLQNLNEDDKQEYIQHVLKGLKNQPNEIQKENKQQIEQEDKIQQKQSVQQKMQQQDNSEMIESDKFQTLIKSKHFDQSQKLSSPRISEKSRISKVSSYFTNIKEDANKNFNLDLISQNNKKELKKLETLLKQRNENINRIKQDISNREQQYIEKQEEFFSHRENLMKFYLTILEKQKDVEKKKKLYNEINTNYNDKELVDLALKEKNYQQKLLKQRQEDGNLEQWISQNKEQEKILDNMIDLEGKLKLIKKQKLETKNNPDQQENLRQNMIEEFAKQEREKQELIQEKQKNLNQEEQKLLEQEFQNENELLDLVLNQQEQQFRNKKILQDMNSQKRLKIEKQFDNQYHQQMKDIENYSRKKQDRIIKLKVFTQQERQNQEEIRQQKLKDLAENEKIRNQNILMQIQYWPEDEQDRFNEFHQHIEEEIQNEIQDYNNHEFQRLDMLHNLAEQERKRNLDIQQTKLENFIQQEQQRQEQIKLNNPLTKEKQIAQQKLIEMQLVARNQNMTLNQFLNQKQERDSFNDIDQEEQILQQKIEEFEKKYQDRNRQNRTQIDMEIHRKTLDKALVHSNVEQLNHMNKIIEELEDKIKQQKFFIENPQNQQFQSQKITTQVTHQSTPQKQTYTIQQTQPQNQGQNILSSQTITKQKFNLINSEQNIDQPNVKLYSPERKSTNDQIEKEIDYLLEQQEKLFNDIDRLQPEIDQLQNLLIKTKENIDVESKEVQKLEQTDPQYKEMALGFNQKVRNYNEQIGMFQQKKQDLIDAKERYKQNQESIEVLKNKRISYQQIIYQIIYFLIIQ